MKISVVVPTTCEARREALLRRALNSLKAQQDVNVDIILVVNGTQYDPELLKSLRARTDLRVFYLEEGNLPAALRYGRMQVRCEFFAFLDDDDEYYPNALRTRVAPMLSDATIDAVATNGFSLEGDVKRLRVRNPQAVNRDPLEALIVENWLASCGGLFRSATVDLDFFDGTTKYFEWTLLAFRLAQARRKVLFLEEPTYCVYDTPESLSKTREYHQSLVGFLEFLVTFEVSPQVHRALRYKLGNAWHGVAADYLSAGQRARAWRAHWKSLMAPGGWRYLGYSRHLVFAWFADRARVQG